MKKCYLCIASAAVGILFAFTYVSHANNINFVQWITSEDVMIQLYLGKVALVPYVLGMAFVGWVAASAGWQKAIVPALFTFLFFVFAGTLKSGGVPAEPPTAEVFAMLTVLTIAFAEGIKRLYSAKQPAAPEPAKPNNA